MKLLSVVRLEIATQSDIPAIVDIWISANTARMDDKPYRENPGVVEWILRRRIREPDALFVLAKIGQELIGVGHQLPAKDDDGKGKDLIPGLMHISLIAVDPRYWGKGVGTALTRYCIDDAITKGYHAIQLWTYASNSRAQQIYVRLGFAHHGRTKLDDNNDNDVVQLYSRSLV